MWESGEADLVVGDLSIRGIVANEHMEIATRFGIRGLPDDITEAVNIQALDASPGFLTPCVGPDGGSG